MPGQCAQPRFKFRAWDWGDLAMLPCFLEWQAVLDKALALECASLACNSTIQAHQHHFTTLKVTCTISLRKHGISRCLRNGANRAFQVVQQQNLSVSMAVLQESLVLHALMASKDACKRPRLSGSEFVGLPRLRHLVLNRLDCPYGKPSCPLCVSSDAD